MASLVSRAASSDALPSAAESSSRSRPGRDASSSSALQHSEGRAQFVSGISDECPLAVKRVVKATEQLVHRLGEGRDLVVRPGDCDGGAPARFGESGHLAPKPLDGREGCPTEPVRAEPRDEQDDDPGDHEARLNVAHGAVYRPERCGGHRHPSLVRAERLGDDALGFVLERRRDGQGRRPALSKLRRSEQECVTRVRRRAAKMARGIEDLDDHLTR